MSKESGKLGDFNSDPEKIKIAIIKAKFNSDITDEMANKSNKRLLELGVKNIKNFEVPGSFELPYACKKVINDFDGIIAIGCLVKGETDHYKYIAQYSTYGIQKIAIEASKPIIFGILTVENKQQALDRIDSSITYAENAVEMICNY